MYGHIKQGKDFNSVRFIKCDVKLLNYYEERWIIRFKPEYNKVSRTPIYRKEKKEYVLGVWGDYMSMDEALWRLANDPKMTSDEVLKLRIPGFTEPDAGGFIYREHRRL